MEAIRFKYEDIDGDFITLRTNNLTSRRIPIPLCLENKKGKGRVFKRWESSPHFLSKKIRELGFKNGALIIFAIAGHSFGPMPECQLSKS